MTKYKIAILVKGAMIGAMALKTNAHDGNVVSNFDARNSPPVIVNRYEAPDVAEFAYRRAIEKTGENGWRVGYEGGSRLVGMVIQTNFGLGFLSYN